MSQASITAATGGQATPRRPPLQSDELVDDPRGPKTASALKQDCDAPNLDMFVRKTVKPVKKQSGPPAKNDDCTLAVLEKMSSRFDAFQKGFEASCARNQDTLDRMAQNLEAHSADYYAGSEMDYYDDDYYDEDYQDPMPRASSLTELGDTVAKPATCAADQAGPSSDMPAGKNKNYLTFLVKRLIM